MRHHTHPALNHNISGLCLRPQAVTSMFWPLSDSVARRVSLVSSSVRVRRLCSAARASSARRSFLTCSTRSEPELSTPFTGIWHLPQVLFIPIRDIGITMKNFSFFSLQSFEFMDASENNFRARPIRFDPILPKANEDSGIKTPDKIPGACRRRHRFSDGLVVPPRYQSALCHEYMTGSPGTVLQHTLCPPWRVPITKVGLYR